MRIRKNINCLSTNQLHDLREAFAALYQLPDAHPNSYVSIAGLHGSPGTSYCIHGNNGFLSWHRAYLLELENALRTIHCDVTIPYWNWSSGNTTGVPSALRNPTYVNRQGNTVANPLYSAPKPASVGGGQTARRSNINSTTFGDLASTAQIAVTHSNWFSFVSTLNSVHGSVHGRIGGDMGSVPTAGFDPIFHLHHCNVDRLWANWQVANPITLPSVEANTNLDPFTRPYTNVWHQGGDFEHIHDWDYTYQNWCFVWPVINWPIEKRFNIPIGDWMFKSDNMLLNISWDHMPKESFEIRIFINNPRATANSKIVGNKSFAGSIGVFGMGNAKMLMRKSEEFKLSLDITSRLRECVKKKDKDCSINVIPILSKEQQKNIKHLTHAKVDLEVF